jgi:nicotinamidase-related amidase
MEVEYLLVTGVATNACVESTARDASDRGYWTYLVEDACATFDPASHEATLRSFRAMAGRVGSTDRAIAELEASLAARSRDGGHRGPTDTASALDAPLKGEALR